MKCKDMNSIRKIPTSFLGLFVTSLILMTFIFVDRYSIFNVLTVTPLLSSIIKFLIFGVFMVFFVLSSIKFFRNLKLNRFFLITMVLSFLAISTFIYYSVYEENLNYNQKFKLLYSELQDVAELISDEKLKSYEVDSAWGYKYIELPLKYRYLSRGGEVWVEQEGDDNSIFFIVSSDFMGEHFFGYVYRSDDKEPSSENFDGSFIDNKKLSEHWFWKKAW